MDVEGDAQIFGRIDIQSAGTDNTFIGSLAGINISTGVENTFLGVKSGFLNQTGSANSYFGHEAGRNNTSGSENCSFGRFALANNQVSSKNLAIGSRALFSLVDGFGHDPVAMNEDLGTTYNLAIGTSAGQFTNDLTRVGAERNTFVGHNSGLFNTTGFRNAFFGFQAGDDNLTGDYNTCIGHEATVSSGNLTNAGAFGSVAIVNASNKIRIGDGSVTVIEGQVDWSFPSDGRFKKNIEENVPGLAFLLQLRPVTYQFDVAGFNAHVSPERDRKRSKNDPKRLGLEERERTASAIVQTGLIAQEVERTAREIGFDFNGVITPKNEKDNYGISYGLFVAPIIKGIQEQQKAMEMLQEKVTVYKKVIDSQEGRIEKLENTVKVFTALVEKLMDERQDK